MILRNNTITGSGSIPTPGTKLKQGVRHKNLTPDFLMWAVFSRVILEMGMALFFVKMEKIWQDSDRRKN
jgi:hypothetical protein